MTEDSHIPFSDEPSVSFAQDQLNSAELKEATGDPGMFPTPPETKYFPFVQEDDEGKLFPLIASYLTIGEFELAKGT